MIKVVTLDHGTFEFPNDDGWETLSGCNGDEGNLAVGTWTDDEVLEPKAEFAKGSWQIVYKVVDEKMESPADEVDYSAVHDYVHVEDEPELPPGPRKWEQARLVPEGVVAKVADGLFIVLIGGRHYINAVANGFGVPPEYDDGWIEASEWSLSQPAEEVFL